MSPITYLLLAVNLLVFYLQAQSGAPLLERYALWPIGEGFMAWQLFTSAFLHGSLLHLGTNMFGLWMFGREVERVLGPLRFLQLYGLSVFTAALTQLVVTWWLQQWQPTVGASGGLFGVLAAFALLFPERRVLLLFPPIPMPARAFVVFYAVFELYAGVTGTMAGVAHFAHLGGLFGGGWLLWRWRAARREP